MKVVFSWWRNAISSHINTGGVGRSLKQKLRSKYVSYFIYWRFGNCCGYPLQEDTLQENNLASEALHKYNNQCSVFWYHQMQENPCSIFYQVKFINAETKTHLINTFNQQLCNCLRLHHLCFIASSFLCWALLALAIANRVSLTNFVHTSLRSTFNWSSWFCIQTLENVVLQFWHV